MSGLGSSLIKIWTCGSSPRSGSRNAWTRIKNVNGASRLSKFGIFWRDPNYFLSRLVSMDETWLYHYDPETKQQSMDWRHSGSPRPKKFRVQKSTGKFSPRFFWDQDGVLHIDYLPKGQTIKAEYYLSLLMQMKDNLKEKGRGKVTKGVLFLHDNSPAHQTLATRRNWPTWASGVLITHPILRIWPHRNTTCSLDWKNDWKSPFFVLCGGHCFRGDLFGRTNFWIFLSDLNKLEQRAKKCIELRGEYVE